MKYSDYFHAPGIRTTSLFFGGVAGLAISLFAGWQYGVLAGAAVAFFASFLIPLSLYREERPYARIKATMVSPLLLDERVRFTVRGGTVGGFLLLTERDMVFLSLEKGDHRLSLSRGDIRSIILERDGTLRVFINDSQFIRVISGDSEKIYTVLSENGWTKD